MDSFIELVLLKTFLGTKWLTKGINTNQKTTMLAVFQLIKSENGIKIMAIAKGMASMLLILVMFWFFTRLGLYIGRYTISLMEWQK
tara:strand:- start:114 stop:371 length:258 start_codon:yes stop_codon:yes gene_type:complete